MLITPKMSSLIFCMHEYAGLGIYEI